MVPHSRRAISIVSGMPSPMPYGVRVTYLDRKSALVHATDLIIGDHTYVLPRDTGDDVLEQLTAAVRAGGAAGHLRELPGGTDQPRCAGPHRTHPYP